MEFKLLSSVEKEKYEEEILNMLKDADDDFLPPLSKRNVNRETNRNTFSDVRSEQNIRNYCSAMLKESVLAIFEGDALCGFVSFAENLKNEIITETPNIYIGTAVIAATLRGKGALTKAYDHLFNDIFRDRNIFTRTWSTNAAHIKVLSKFSFDEIKRIKDDRGEGIDTIYFLKRR